MTLSELSKECDATYNMRRRKRTKEQQNEMREVKVAKQELCTSDVTNARELERETTKRTTP